MATRGHDQQLHAPSAHAPKSCRAVVSGGLTCTAPVTSSNPITETSRGTATPSATGVRRSERASLWPRSSRAGPGRRTGTSASRTSSCGALTMLSSTAMSVVHETRDGQGPPPGHPLVDQPPTRHPRHRRGHPPLIDHRAAGVRAVGPRPAGPRYSSTKHRRVRRPAAVRHIQRASMKQPGARNPEDTAMGRRPNQQASAAGAIRTSATMSRRTQGTATACPGGEPGGAQTQHARADMPRRRGGDDPRTAGPTERDGQPGGVRVQADACEPPAGEHRDACVRALVHEGDGVARDRPDPRRGNDERGDPRGGENDRRRRHGLGRCARRQISVRSSAIASPPMAPTERAAPGRLRVLQRPGRVRAGPRHGRP